MELRRTALVLKRTKDDDPRRVTLGELKHRAELHQRVLGRGVQAEMEDNVDLDGLRVVGLEGLALQARAVRPHFVEPFGDGADGHVNSGEGVENRGHRGRTLGLTAAATPAGREPGAHRPRWGPTSRRDKTACPRGRTPPRR